MSALKGLQALTHVVVNDDSMDENPILRPSCTAGQKRRFQSLFQTLGRVPTISSAIFHYHNGAGEFIGMALQNLTQIGRLCIQTSVRGGHDVANLASGLQNDSSIKILELTVPPEYYPIILPVVSTIRSLEVLELRTNYAVRVLEPASALALGLLMSQESKLRVLLEKLNCSSAELHASVCTALAGARIRRLEMQSCCFGIPPSILAAALTRSQIKEVQIDDLHYDVNDFADFLSAVARGMPSMPSLEWLQYRPNMFFPANQWVEDAARDAVLAARYCHHLKHICLTFDAYSRAIDEALGDLARTSASLESLQLFKPHRVQYPGGYHGMSAFYQAMKTNYKIRTVNFNSHKSTLSEAWDDDDQMNIRTLLDLNKAGRGYIVKDATNRNSTVKVLEQVNDKLDCIFVH